MRFIVLFLALLGLIIVVKFWYVALPLIVLGVYLGWKVADKYYSNNGGN